VAQGANDVRVKRSEGDQLAAAMRKNGKPIEYIVFPKEGHGFAKPEDYIKFRAREEAFLAKYWVVGWSLPPSLKNQMIYYIDFFELWRHECLQICALVACRLAP
jgi:acetyl esterase/lipase